MPAFLTLALVRKLAPYLLGAGLVLAAVLWVHGMQATIARQGAQLSDLSGRLAAEKLARTKDVAGLTALASGTAAATIDNKRDATILSETIDHANPAPASRDLAALLGKLRDADTAAGVRAATTGPGSAAATGAGNPGRGK